MSSIITCQELQTTSTILLGDSVASTSAYFFHDPNNTNARVDLYLGNYTTVPGEFRIYNSAQNLAGGILEVQKIQAVSSINSVGFADGNIDAQNVTAEVGFTLAGAGTFTINGNAGAEGQVIQISGGYPEWGNVSTIQPQQFYSTFASPIPVFSTFSTVIQTTFTSQTNTGSGFATATVSWLNDGVTSIGDNLTLAFATGAGLIGPVSTTSVFANGYQSVTLQQAIANSGTPLTLSVSMRKPDTDNVYTVQSASLNIITDLL